MFSYPPRPSVSKDVGKFPQRAVTFHAQPRRLRIFLLSALSIGLSLGSFGQAFAERLKPRYVACDSADSLASYTAAVASGDRARLRQLWDKRCFSTNRLSHVPNVKVLNQGPMIRKIRVTGGRESLDLWTYEEALEKSD